MTKIEVAIVDDDPSVRNSLGVLLAASGFETHEFESGRSFLSDSGNWTNPIVALVDVRMPGMDGIELLKELEAANAPVSVIMITGQADVGLAVRAMKNGAVDFLEKPFEHNRLIDAIKEAANSQRADRMTRKTDRDALQKISSLSAREREVFDYLIGGDPNKVIAHHMGISTRTVEVHRAHVMEKLGVRNLAKLIRMAFAAGIEGE